MNEDKPPRLPPFFIELDDDAPEELHQAAAVTDQIIDTIIEMYSVGLEPVTDDQLDAMRAMVEAGMMYGWQFAQSDDDRVKTDMRRRSTEVRRLKADDRHAEIRQAWEKALAEDPDITVEALAKRLHVGRATAYRAIHGSAR